MRQKPPNIGALKSMHFLCKFAHNYFYKMYFLTKNSNLLVFRDTFINNIFKTGIYVNFCQKMTFLYFQKNDDNNIYNLQSSHTKNEIILTFLATVKRILLELSKNVRKAPIY